MANDVEVWRKGESLAQEFLKKNKYKIIATNYRNIYGEIDIVAQKKDVLVFVEVKAKTNDNYGLPREMITPHKIIKIKQTAQGFLTENSIDSLCRFDCIEVLNGKINHIENAF